MSVPAVFGAEAVETYRCPGCGRGSVVFGQMIGVDGQLVGFAPHHCPASPLPAAFVACVSCGLVWSAVDPDRLREHIAKHGREIARQWLDEIDSGPYRGLPDTAIAREVAEKVAEIDALVRSGRTGAAGRYRELRGVAWDQALKDVRRWAKLTREEKLALFGWTPKKKAVLDDLDAPFS